jgi:hypothetical protein
MARPTNVRVAHVITTQQTSKPYKAAKACGYMLLMIGSPAIWVAVANDASADWVLGSAAIAGTGVILMVYSRIGRWWNNE